MKTRKALFIATFLVAATAFFATACEGTSRDTPAFSLRGEVSRDLHVGAMWPSDAYHVDITVRNVSKQPLAFDYLQVIFASSPEGRGLQTTVAKRGGSLLLPNSEESFAVDTNGYTRDLLLDAQGKPLKVIIVLVRREEMVGRPSWAELPPLKELPDYYAVRTGKTTGVPLLFY
jgi:hypothetical protein